MLVTAVLFFILAVAALYWSAKSGQWKQLHETSISIFNDEEPEGVQSDFFPGRQTIKDKNGLKTNKFNQ